MHPQGKGWPRPDIEVQASDPEPLTRIVQVDSVEVIVNDGCEWPLLPDRCGAVIRCNGILMRVTDQGRSFNARGNLGKGLKLAEATHASGVASDVTTGVRVAPFFIVAKSLRFVTPRRHASKAEEPQNVRRFLGGTC